MEKPDGVEGKINKRVSGTKSRAGQAYVKPTEQNPWCAR